MTSMLVGLLVKINTTNFILDTLRTIHSSLVEIGSAVSVEISATVYYRYYTWLPIELINVMNKNDINSTY